MNKKVLSAILFSALFAGTGTFTSCIDNDEPAGIEELRGAKATLLAAKAEIAKADAALVLAKAETEKALAAKGQAEARIKEAEAKIKEAQAAAEEAETEALKAEYAKNAAFWQQEMAEAAKQHEIDMLVLKGQLADAQRTYELALAKIAIAKELFPLDAQFELSALETNVNTWTNNVEFYAAKVDSVQQLYNEAAVEYQYFGKLDTDSLQYTLDTLNVKLANAQAHLTKYENWLEEDVTTKDWRAEVDELTATIDSLNKLTANNALNVALAQHSTEYKALLAAQAEANKAATVDSVYGYKYFGDANATTLYFGNNGTKDTTMMSNAVIAEAAAKKALVVDALDTIARYDAAGTLLAGKLYDDKKELAGFTAEVKHFLDSVAAMKTEADTIFEYNSKVAIKGWKDALAAYNGVDATMDKKFAVADSMKTVWASTSDKSAKKIDAYRKALLDYLTVAKKNGAVLNNVLAPQDSAVVLVSGTNYAKLPTVAKEDPLTVLADTTKTFGAIETYSVDFLSSTADEQTATGVAHKTTAKVEDVKYMANAIKTAAKTVAELESALVAASTKAFGEASLYNDLDAAYTHGKTNYLHVQPDSADVMNIVFFNGVNNAAVHATNGYVGEYGKFLIAKNDEVKAYALTYKDRIKNLEAAITYWEATYKTLSAKYTAWETAKKAADKAVADYKKANIDNLAEKNGEIIAETTRLGNIKTALQTAIEVYLPAALDGKMYGTEAFETALEGIVSQARSTVNSLARKVAAAKKAVELNECDSYSELAKQELALENAIADLEEAQDELDAALADLAKALEIYEATIAE